MDPFLLGTLSSLLGTIFFEAIKTSYNSLTLTSDFEEGIETTLMSELSSYVDFDQYEQNLPRIQEFFQHPLVADVFQQYCIYKIVGNTQQSSNDNSSAQQLTDDKISSRIISLYTSFVKEPLSQELEKTLTELVIQILGILKKTIFTKLTIQNQRSIILVNDRIDNAVMCITDRLDSIQKMMEKSFTFSLEEIGKDYEEIAKTYTSLIKENYSHSAIYLLDDIAFDEFYIPPIISKYTCLDFEHDDFDNELEKEDYNYHNSWKSIFFASNTVYVIAKAGYGKSLLLKKIVNSYHELSIMNAVNHIVIYCDLKTFFYAEQFAPEVGLGLLTRIDD